jgi:hypothetical protein
MDLPVDHDLPAFFSEVGTSQGTMGPIGELVAQIATGHLDPISYHSICERHGVAREPWLRSQCLDLVLSYVRHCLTSGQGLSPEHVRSLRALQSFLRVRDGEFLALRPAEVASVIREQLDEILADAVIDDGEELYQVELQAVFGLGYDDYLAMTRVVFERVSADLSIQARAAEAPAAAAAAKKLDTLAPVVRIATARARTLGALYG